MRRDQLIFDVGVGLGLVGFISLVFYGLSKLDKEDNNDAEWDLWKILYHTLSDN